MDTPNQDILLETRIFEVILLDNDCVNFSIKPNVTCELEDAMDYIQAGISIERIMGGPYPVITTINGMIVLSKEAKAFIRKYSKIEFYLANAIVVQKLFLRGMMRLITTLIPSQGFPEEIFADRASGTRWLEKQVKVRTWRAPRIPRDILKQKLQEDFYRSRQEELSVEKIELARN